MFIASTSGYPSHTSEEVCHSVLSSNSDRSSWYCTLLFDNLTKSGGLAFRPEALKKLIISVVV